MTYPNLYRATLRTDSGPFVLTVNATSYGAAVESITAVERCPERAIVRIERVS